MRVARVAVVVALALLSASCLVVSLHPFYEPESIAFDPTLVGTWASADDDVTLTFERGGWHSYHLTVARRDDRLRATVRLTRIANALFLDLTPLDGTDVTPLALPIHTCYRIEIGESTLTLAELSYDWLKSRARAGGAGMPMTVDGRANVVLTGTTAEVRQWLARHADEEGVFVEPTPFTRR